MTEHTKQPPSSGGIAYQLARDLMEQLSVGCVRISIAGSIRRGKETPGDIEIVAVPATGEYQVKDMFDLVIETVVVNRLHETLNELFHRGTWNMALNQATLKPLRDGPKHKKLVHSATGVLCDLFMTETRHWGYTYVIRTGPAEFSHALVTRALNLHMFFNGCLLHNHPPVFEVVQGKREVQPCPYGDLCSQIIETPEEQAIFDALHLAYLSPVERGRIDPRSILRG